MQTITLQLYGMNCTSCAGRIEKALLAVPGVETVNVHLLNEQATIKGQALEISALTNAVKQAGYTAQAAATLQTSAQTTHATKNPPKLTVQYKALIQHDTWPMLLALAMTLPLVLPMLLMPLGVHWYLPVLWQWVLATPVQFVCGARFYRGAWQALRAGHGTMDMLVVLGTSAAYGLSVWLWWQQGNAAATQVYFESSAVVIALVLLGKWLESRAKYRTNAALQGLAQLQPTIATIERTTHDGNKHLETLAIGQVQVGDVVVVAAGQYIAVDGTVVAGSSHVDESLLTGESLPIAKHTGDTVRAGAMNGEATLWVCTKQVGEHTLLGRIMTEVQTAQSTKAPIQRLADKISALFVPIVVLIALATGLLSVAVGLNIEEATLRAVAVLVISCPCALGLATPTAIVVGTGLAARQGIFIHHAQALETMHRLSAIVLDKTGTLTQGQPTLQNMAHSPHCNADTLLSLAASILQHNTHPLAKAVLKAAAKKIQNALPVVDNTTVVPGCGITATLNGQTLRLGQAKWLRQEGVELDTEEVFTKEVDTWQQQGHTISLLALGSTLYGAFAFADEIKPEAQQALKLLKDMGLSLHLQSGDNPKAVHHLANRLGIDHAMGGALPSDKLAYIENLQAQGECVAMVGDGINDAPALAKADVGMAMATGTDVANQLASVSLLGGNLIGIAQAITIAKKTFTTIQQNLFWAFAYNVVGIPLAAFGLLNPMVAGAAMAFSSLCVVGNALYLQQRIKHF